MIAEHAKVLAYIAWLAAQVADGLHISLHTFLIASELLEDVIHMRAVVQGPFFGLSFDFGLCLDINLPLSGGKSANGKIRTRS